MDATEDSSVTSGGARRTQRAAGRGAAGGAAEADSYRNKQLMEMHQVRTGDYTYQIHDDATVTPRYDRYANYLRATRPARDLWFPDPRPSPHAYRYSPHRR